MRKALWVSHLITCPLLLSFVLGLAWAPVKNIYADEITTLPEAPSSSDTSQLPLQPKIEKIPSDVPLYTDNSVGMAPLAPLCAFLDAHLEYSDGIITLTKTFEQNPPGSCTITMRAGGRMAKVQDAAGKREVRLPMPAEERFGNVFVPLRTVVSMLGGTVERIEGDITIIRSGDRAGMLSPIVQEGYRGPDAAHLTVVNRVGRALSLRLKGPQNLSIELGKNNSITRSIKPGLYYYYAASTGMKTRSGSRRLLAGRKATWAWGRR